MKRNILTLIFSFFLTALYAQKNDNFINKPDWNVYSQIRFTTNFDDNYNFSLRRLKIWFKSAPEFSEHWSYKVQTTLSSIKNETFFLQDVNLGYKTGIWSFDIGQFVPQYSLQRFQPDYKLPVTERARAIDYLIPDGTLGVRDIGIQANLKTKNNLLQTHFGIFNGYGIKEFRFSNNGVMFTHKTEINFKIGNSVLQTGYSGMLRKADNQVFPKILSDTILFSGNDFRYNLFVLYKSKYLDIQGEYLSAYFNELNSTGWYLLSSINLKKHQIVLVYEDYKDLISETDDLPFIHIGYNYLINRYKLKIFFDNYFQINNHSIKNYTTSVQLQFFFKQN